MSFTLKQQVCHLIERKLTGERRQEGLAWVRLHAGDWRALRAMKQRIEALPDTGTPHSRQMLRPERLAELQQEYATTRTPVAELAAKYGVTPRYVYNHCAGLRVPRS